MCFGLAAGWSPPRLWYGPRLAGPPQEMECSVLAAVKLCRGELQTIMLRLKAYRAFLFFPDNDAGVRVLVDLIREQN